MGAISLHSHRTNGQWQDVFNHAMMVGRKDIILDECKWKGARSQVATLFVL